MNTNDGSIRLLQCPDGVKSELTRYGAALGDVLGENLQGVYLCGSLARGCHNPSTSDVDVLAVVRDSLMEEALPLVLQAHRDARIPIDAAFVTASQLRADVFPTPVDFLVKPMEGGRLVRMAEGSRDFLLQRQDAHEAGIALLGPEAQTMMNPVPWPLLARALDFLFPHIVPRFKNPLLMLCRIAYAHKHRHLCCKRRAGEWAIGEFGADWRQAIEESLAEYGGHASGTTVAATTVRDSERYCADYINGLGGTGRT